MTEWRAFPVQLDANLRVLKVEIEFDAMDDPHVQLPRIKFSCAIKSEAGHDKPEDWEQYPRYGLS